MAEWRVRLEGNTVDLLSLVRTMATGNLNVIKDDDQYFLRGSWLENYTTAQDVHAYVESLLPVINGAAQVQDADSELISVASVVRLHDDGRREAAVFLSSAVGIGRARGFAELTVPGAVPVAPLPGGTVGSRVEIARCYPEVDLALRFFVPPFNWFNLYKVCEIIERDMGGSKAIESRGWASKEALGDFTGSANNYHASGLEARHANLSQKPMKRLPMTLQEAQNFIRVLLDQWIRTKVS